MTLFDWLKELTGKKRDWDSFSEKERESFNPYMVNRFVSMHQPFVELVTELTEAFVKIYKCSTREVVDYLLILDKSEIKSTLQKSGYQPKEITKMLK